ncbi:MAG TPA: CDP-alcohol phosphatidyltransferase family protein [Streptosporangiaceae bacterium]
MWTIPNVISMARLAGVPLFLWLVLGPHADLWALLVLILAGVSDWLDGKIARAFNQFSRYGKLLDPAADRLYILVTLIALIIRSVIPWWLAVLLVAREVFALAVQLVVRRHGYGWLPVNFLGKTATMCLMYAFPFLLLGDQPGAIGVVARSIGWAFAIWGTGLYWWAGVTYAVQARRLVVADRVNETSAGGAHAPRASEPGVSAPSRGRERRPADEEPAER